MAKISAARRASGCRAIVTGIAAACAFSAFPAERNAYFGDLHVHTSYSFDAFSFATRTTPDDAYRFARGEVIQHPSGADIQLDRPLDFYAVTDHAAYLGVLQALANPVHPMADDPDVRRFTTTEGVLERGGYLPNAAAFVASHSTLTIARSACQDIVAAAQRHYEPGVLTTFVGYEYTPSREGGNLHRNVIFKNEKTPRDIFSRLDSTNPEDLWTWMDEQRLAGFEMLSIPHNSNGSDGWMFETRQFDGSPIDAAYAAQRMRNEPLVEITQVKGTSETHPFLSPNDEWADFEIFPFRIAQFTKSKPRGSYVREAWLNGAAMEAEAGFNPYRFGVVGASDTHNSGHPFAESEFTGKVGVHDIAPINRGSIPSGSVNGMPAYRETYRRFYSSSGMTGVWADANDRESIYAAFRRKETFATSGTRIKIRAFAGFGLPEDLHESRDMAAIGYARGTPMGGELPTDAPSSPTVVAMALRDPLGAPLARLQVIKGWIDNGARNEAVYDVACSEGARPNQDARCPDNGATVDLATCTIASGIGAEQLAASWRDPNFDPDQNAFYYVRALENPTCRWSTWDAVRSGVAPRQTLPATIEERAWTSPIWYSPSR